MLERVWRKGNPLTLLAGMQTSTATMENSMESPSKLGIKLPFAVLAVFSHSAAFVSDSLKLHGTSVHGDSPGKNTGMD